jgi:DNA ligase-1
MLAKKVQDFPNIDVSKYFVQYKYNGHRCLITNDGDRNIAYSRNGKEINTIQHILDTVDIPQGVTLDGELYVHGELLQNISSLVRKVQPWNAKLEYIAYDIMLNKPYSYRLEELMSRYESAKISIAPTRYGPMVDSISNALRGAISEGYEGLILRDSFSGYEAGKRSSSLIKVKQALDAEFIVTNIHPSADGWAILECSTAHGGIFRVSAPGTIDDKIHVLQNPEHYIGELVNVEFFEWTKDGKPFHPVAKYFIFH